MDAERFYDNLGEGYLDTFKTESMAKVFRSENDLVLSHIPNSPPRPNVLEIGTGPGRLAAKVVTRNVCFTGIDLSQTMVQACQHRIGPGHTLIHHDVSRGLPFADETFDYIYSIRVLKYVRDLSELLRDAHRVLAPGGTLLFSMPNLLSINALQLRQHVSYQRYSIKRTKEILDSCGFSSVGIIGGPKLPDIIYQRKSERLSRLITSTESGLDRFMGCRLTREPFYECRKPTPT
jgi:ubiquinone/menaquinone biosynthesis C-methylase UbiE